MELKLREANTGYENRFFVVKDLEKKQITVGEWVGLLEDCAGFYCSVTLNKEDSIIEHTVYLDQEY